MAVGVSRLTGLALACCALTSCSDRSAIESDLLESRPHAELSDFKSITPMEYADALDEWMKPIAGSKWRPTGRETVAKPQFKAAKYYSVQTQVTYGYGNVAKHRRYCSVLGADVSCMVTKSLTSLADVRRGAPDR